ncbi:hypothetical protein DFO67_12446 [Modicisalibacter xianhensis]|uniref:Uncharacterized protein n=1 Tax=Modicisalibacter xianhensis TaxID=442341 RepID=A0A4R8FDE1_9GAMM|nr:hypothetical protein [Halomonas xianhensis]TDX23729.1 hypothetical protein DFO67_12446 [Halomonas xianhensis]
MVTEARFKIRDFGRDTWCNSVDELIATLRSRYATKSVSVQYRTKATGSSRVVFVDVDPDAIRHSYQDRNEVDFCLIESEAL